MKSANKETPTPAAKKSPVLQEEEEEEEDDDDGFSSMNEEEMQELLKEAYAGIKGKDGVTVKGFMAWDEVRLDGV